MSGPEVVLHAGLHKTGTTSIQRTFFLPANNRQLEEFGVIYPRSHKANHSHAVYTGFADDPDRLRRNVRNGYSPPDIEDDRATVLASLRSELQTRPGRQVVFSAEELSSLSEASLGSLKHFLESVFATQPSFRVAIYVRSPMSWMASVIQEKIKAGMTYAGAYDEMKRIAPHLYQGRIEKFFAVFGRTAVHVHEFESAAAHELGVVGHFLSFLGLRRQEIESLNLVRANESVSQVAADLISFVNERLASAEGAGASLQDLEPLLKLRGPKFAIPQRDRQVLQDLVYGDVRWLRKASGIDYGSSASTGSRRMQMTPELMDDVHAAKALLPSRIAALVDEYFASALRAE